MQICFSVGAGLPAMRAPWCIRHTQSIPSQASQLPHLDPVHSHLMRSDPNVGLSCLGRALGRPVAYALRQSSWLAGPVESRSASDQQQICFCVGAGLPAMRAPRCIRHTRSIPSQASQLPHLDQYSHYPDAPGSKCGSGLARECGGAFSFSVADTPPSQASPFHIDRRQPSEPQLMRGPPPPG